MSMLGHSNNSSSSFSLSGKHPMPGKEYKREYRIRSKHLLFISHLSMCFLYLQSAWSPSAFHNPCLDPDGAADRRAVGFYFFCLDQGLWVLPDSLSSSLIKYRNFTPLGTSSVIHTHLGPLYYRISFRQNSGTHLIFIKSSVNFFCDTEE